MLVEQQVVEVYDPYSESAGSGYLLSCGLVLTAQHVVQGSLPDGGPLDPSAGSLSTETVTAIAQGHRRCRIRPLDRSGRSMFVNALVVWWSPHVDVALLLTDEALPGTLTQPVPVTWGDLTGTDSVDVTAVGFPKADVTAGVRESRQIWGTVAPLSLVKKGRWSVQVSGRIGASAARSTSAWAGMSGAALFADDILVGIVGVDPDPSDLARMELWALPARTFGDDDGFLSWTRCVGGERAWTRSSTDPVGTNRLLRQFVEANRLLPVLDDQSIRKLATALDSFQHFDDDKASRRTVAGIVAMMRAKNVLHVILEDEFWWPVFESLRELRDALARADAELLVTGPQPVESAVSAMLTAVRNYLGRHEASFKRHTSDRHSEADWPGLHQAELELLSLREALEALSTPLSRYLGKGEEDPGTELGATWEFGSGTVGEFLDRSVHGQSAEPSWNVLLTALHSKVASVSLVALDQIAIRGGNRATDELIALLSDQDDGIRSRAFLALSTVPQSAPRAEHIPALVAAAIGAEDQYDRREVLKLLAPFAARDEVAELFITAIAEGNIFDRSKLPQLPASGVAGQLNGLLNEPNGSFLTNAFAEGDTTMRRAVLALLVDGYSTFIRTPDQQSEVDDYFLSYANSHPHPEWPVAELVRSALSDTEPLVRFIAISVAWACLGEQATPLLINALDDPDPHVHRRALSLLRGAPT